jgi:23S rRNA (cytosine1962-C5)-methyltransferase
LAGHPWVYRSDLLPLKKPPADGEVIVVRSQSGGFIAKGFFNSKSEISVRIMTRDKNEELDDAWLRRRLAAAIDFRKNFCKPRPARRLVWSEADLLSGLIVDQYGGTLVLQTLSLAMDRRKSAVAGILRELAGSECILERNDVPSRRHEGLTEIVSVLDGIKPAPSPVRLGSGFFGVDFMGGHKTGTYLDQQENWETVAALCKGKAILDCFTYEGGFAIHAALAGAASVQAVDISEEAIAAARSNAALNKVSCDFVQENVFDRLTQLVQEGKTFDVVILDPPSFTKTRDKLGDALRGYKQIHLKALRLLRPGGLLATFCCSHHVDSETFRAVALDAAFDTRKTLRLLATFSQPPDHPILPAVPETEYLKGHLFQVI